MILDRLKNSDLYVAMHPLFKKAFDFLGQTNWSMLDDGKIEIAGDLLFAIVSSDRGRGRENSPLEIHRKYIDIQLVLRGADEMGWRPLADCHKVSTLYDPDRDIGFFSDDPESWFVVNTQSFAVFYPSDAHAPLAGQGAIRKVVIKVAA